MDHMADRVHPDRAGAMSAALAGYLAVTQIAARLDLTLPDDIAAG